VTQEKVQIAVSVTSRHKSQGKSLLSDESSEKPCSNEPKAEGIVVGKSYNNDAASIGLNTSFQQQATSNVTTIYNQVQT